MEYNQIIICPYCNLNTAGQHKIGCPNYRECVIYTDPFIAYAFSSSMRYFAYGELTEVYQLLGYVAGKYDSIIICQKCLEKILDENIIEIQNV